MNKLLLLSSIFFGAYSFSQVELNNTDLKPSIGEKFVYKSTGIQAPPTISEGANQTWDISSIVGTTTSETECKSSQNTLANVLLSEGDFNGYYNYTAASLEYIGATAPGMTENYSNTKLILDFPLELNAETTDTYTSTLTITGAPSVVTTTGNQTIKVFGHGTLITAEGTYTNVLAVIRTATENIAQGGQTATITKVETLFYKAGIHNHIARIAMQNSSGNVSHSAMYLSAYSLSMDEVNNQLFVIVPNPSTDGFHIKGDQVIESIQLVDMSGKVVPVDFNASTNFVDISNLTAGIYTLQVITNYGITSQKVVKK